MKRHSSRDLAHLADLFPDAVACRRELIRLGVDPSRCSRRCLPGGGWTRLLPGIYLLTGGQPARRQLVQAALLRAGPLSVVTGVEALRRHGVRRLPAETPVHVLVPHGQRVSSRSFLLVERTNRAWDELVVDRIPLVPPARALIDAARRLDGLDVIRAMISDAVQHGICRVDSLRQELVNLRLGGTSLPRRVLAEVDDGVRSAAEAWARTLVLRSSLPAPRWNVELHDSRGYFLGIVDAWWDEVALAWEIDSREFHLAPADYERTLDRHSALAGAGVLVVHTLPSKLKKDPAGVVRDLLGAYQFAAARRRPAVTSALWRPTG